MKQTLLSLALAILSIVAFAQNNVGIGTTTPTEKLTVKATGKGISQESPNGDVKIGFFTADAGGAFLQTHSNHPLRFSTNNGATQMVLLQNGNFGIGVPAPAYPLDVAGRIRLTNQADGNSAGVLLNNPANTAIIGFMGIANANTLGLYGNPSGWALAMNTNTGNIGIKTLTPRCPLEVAGYTPFGIASNYAYFALGFSNFQPIANTGGTTNSSPVNVSIYASDRIVGFEFNAFSDTRIKNIVSRSNSAKDLETISALQITDYTLKDHIKNGNRQFKKVIAQEVEEVYPQVVSKHTDFIPNVYQLSSTLKSAHGGCLITFKTNHHISKSAKKLQVIVEGTGMQQFDIVSIPSENEVVINATDLKTEKVFVYGEEVDDFRTVDYEGLTTLNISATQELSKLLKMQQAQINEQNKKIDDLKKIVGEMKTEIGLLTTKTALSKL